MADVTPGNVRRPQFTVDEEPITGAMLDAGVLELMLAEGRLTKPTTVANIYQAMRRARHTEQTEFQ